MEQTERMDEEERMRNRDISEYDISADVMQLSFTIIEWTNFMLQAIKKPDYIVMSEKERIGLMQFLEKLHDTAGDMLFLVKEDGRDKCIR